MTTRSSASIQQGIDTRRHNLLTKPHTIYALVDPRDSRICYVGVTINPKGRMISHMCVKKPYVASPKLALWIRELLEARLRPVLVVIETVPYQQAHQRERFWIVKLHNHGAPLRNDKYIANSKNYGRSQGMQLLRSRYPNN